jgi:hypothetical protein
MTIKPDLLPRSKPQTREEYLRELIVGQEFLILKNNDQIAEGMIIKVLNTEVVMVDLWRDGNRASATTHYYPFNELKWDEFTQTGVAFGPLPVQD